MGYRVRVQDNVKDWKCVLAKQYQKWIACTCMRQCEGSEMCTRRRQISRFEVCKCMKKYQNWKSCTSTMFLLSWLRKEGTISQSKMWERVQKRNRLEILSIVRCGRRSKRIQAQGRSVQERCSQHVSTKPTYILEACKSTANLLMVMQKSITWRIEVCTIQCNAIHTQSLQNCLLLVKNWNATNIEITTQSSEWSLPNPQIDYFPILRVITSQYSEWLLPNAAKHTKIRPTSAGSLSKDSKTRNLDSKESDKEKEWRFLTPKQPNTRSVLPHLLATCQRKESTRHLDPRQDGLGTHQYSQVHVEPL